MAIATSIKRNLSGQITFDFQSSDDLTRLLEVLDAGLREYPMFNEDIAELANEIRTQLED